MSIDLSLAARCAEAIGVDPKESPLCQVLSCFPDKAELFIQIQESFAKIMGEKCLWLETHFSNHWVGHEQFGRKFYNSDNREILSEILNKYKYTGEYILSFIDYIEHLRGVGLTGRFDFDQNVILSHMIIGVFDSLSSQTEITEERGKIVSITISIMGVTSEEIDLLRQISDASEQYGELFRKADKLRERAQQIQKKGRTIYQTACESVHKTYPRLTSKEN